MEAKQQNKFSLSLAALYLAAAAVLTTAPALILLLFLSSIVFFILLRHTPREDRKYVIHMLGVGIITRLVVLVIVQYVVFLHGKLDIFGDAQDNINKGISISNFLLGKTGSVVTIDAIFSNRYNTHGKIFFNGLFFTLLGKNIFALKYLNILSVALSSWLVYDILRRIYFTKAGKIAMAVVLFWPTLFVWSITDLKESHFILMIIVAFWCIVRLLESGGLRKKSALALLLTASLGYAVTLKFRLLFGIVLVTTVLSALFCIGFLIYRKHPAMVRLVALGIVLLIAGLFIVNRFALPTVFQKYLSVIISYHRGFLSSGGWNYNLLGKGPPNWYSSVFFLNFFFGAWCHFLLEPFPWHLSSVPMLCMYPFMVIWYFLLFFSMLGLLKLSRSGRIWLIMPALIFTFLYISVVGMAVANIGTATRFRDAIMPIIAMLAACGLTMPDKEVQQR